MDIKRLAARGHRVTIIGEKQFWKLVAQVSAKAARR